MSSAPLVLSLWSNTTIDGAPTGSWICHCPLPVPETGQRNCSVYGWEPVSPAKVEVVPNPTVAPPQLFLPVPVVNAVLSSPSSLSLSTALPLAARNDVESRLSSRSALSLATLPVELTVNGAGVPYTLNDAAGWPRVVFATASVSPVACDPVNVVVWSAV